MSQMNFNLEQTKKKLAYYQQLQEKQSVSPSSVLDKWIGIYSERLREFENPSQNPGLKIKVGKTMLGSNQARA